jgi:modified peptide precursor CbpA
LKEVISLKKDIIAYRKACKASGTGLSHYILLGKKKDK